MNGPGPAPSPWLAALGQGLGIAPTAPPAPVDYAAQAGQALGMGPPQAAPAPVMLGGRPLPPDAPPAGPPPPPGAQIPLDGGMSKMPPPEPSRTEAPPPPPAARPTGPQFSLMRSGAAGMVNVPAREEEHRGPSLLRAQDEAAEAVRVAVDAVNERSSTTAAVEFAQTLENQRKAQAREDAMNYSANERQDELEQRQNDFDQSVQALSKMSVDPDRFWASRSTGQKVAGVVSLFLGGFLQGMRGGPNAGLDMLNQYIDRDIEAQKFAYGAARDTAQQQQTAFGMAMQKYQNVDAAKAAARAAALDSVQAQLGQQAALWKSTDAANRAQMAMAELAQLRMQQVQQGVAFMPARQVAVGPTWKDEDGLTYTEAQARDVKKEFRGQVHDLNKGAQGIGGDILKEGYKAQAAAASKEDEGTRQIATALQGANVPATRALAEHALKALNESEGGRLEQVGRKVGDLVLGNQGGNMVMSQSANAREQAYNDFMNAAMKATFGNVTASEEMRAIKSYGSTGDPEARRRSIAAALVVLNEVEKTAKAGASPKAQAEFDRRRAIAEGGPPAAPKGATKGW